jgi:hypothetical protein
LGHRRENIKSYTLKFVFIFLQAVEIIFIWLRLLLWREREREVTITCRTTKYPGLIKMRTDFLQFRHFTLSQRTRICFEMF